MIEHKYGKFTKEQIEYYKTKLRKKLFWLIIYTDKRTNQEYQDVNVESYQTNLMRQIDGFNSILYYPNEIVDIMATLEAARIELKKEEFNFPAYKKLIFDAGSMIDNLKVGDSNGSV